jgi:hypothetical protein
MCRTPNYKCVVVGAPGNRRPYLDTLARMSLGDKVLLAAV